jgi:hypothetical protein
MSRDIESQKRAARDAYAIQRDDEAEIRQKREFAFRIQFSGVVELMTTANVAQNFTDPPLNPTSTVASRQPE